MATQTTSTEEPCRTAAKGGAVRSLMIGLVVGIVLTAGAVWAFMPRMMLDVRASGFSFDETVSRLQDAVAKQGWVLAGTRDMQKSLSKHGRKLNRRVKIIELCHPDYAEQVLKANRELSAMMPCAIAVYEGDDGKIYVSKMNTALMGRMFGGKVGQVMGGAVARDEKAILSRVLSEG